MGYRLSSSKLEPTSVISLGRQFEFSTSTFVEGTGSEPITLAIAFRCARR